MKTEEKMSMGKAAQVVFRPSSESPGFYRFHYGQLASHGTFVEDPSGSLPAFLEAVGVPSESVTAFVEDIDDSEMEICEFGYFSQERFENFMHCFIHCCDGVQLYPGMLVMSFNEKENED